MNTARVNNVYLLTHQQQQNNFSTNSPCRVRQCLTRGLQTLLGLFYDLPFLPLLHRGYGALRAILPALIQRRRHSGCTASWGKPAQSSSSCATLKQLAERLLPSWVHRSSFKWASKTSDRATETPGAWCGSLDMRLENPISFFQGSMPSFIGHVQGVTRGHNSPQSQEKWFNSGIGLL